MTVGIMARRQALVGKRVELLVDAKTRVSEFERGELLTVNSVGRGYTPIHCSSADGRRIRLREFDIMESFE